MQKTDLRKANDPKPDTNRYLAGNALCQFTGLVNETFQFVETFQLTDAIHWKRFVEQFRIQSDGQDKGWKGEFWGKMMRGACFVYAYTRNSELYRVLTETVEDMIQSSDEMGRISTYDVEQEFQGWDVWCRKYVLLGMEYYLEICQDEAFAERIVTSMKGQADYILSKIGPEEEGKIPITQAAIFWRGLSSSSILEPIVRLYNITKEEQYLAFAEYIVEAGGTSVDNIFQLAYKNQFYPYQYPLTKAYEMISCFEGLLEFYRVKQVAWHKEALIHFADRVLESDFTIIGCSGCTHELFDHSTVRQANTTNGETMQETCVTVTLMKFFYQMTMLTGNPAYVDAFERSFYNAYLGAVNTEGRIGIDVGKIFDGIYAGAIPEALPFDSYSPLTVGTRGNWIGGVQMMPDYHYYGCCACIGSAGVGLVPKMALMKSTTGIVMNLYIPGSMETTTPSGNKMKFILDTDYPKQGTIKIHVEMEQSETFAVAFRNPAWSGQTEIRINQEQYPTNEGYVVIERTWSNGDEITMVLDMRTQVIYPEPYGHDILMNEMLFELDYVVPTYDVEDPEAKNHIALRRGPLILAIESRLGYDAADAFDIAVTDDSYVQAEFPEIERAPYKHMVELTVPLVHGGRIHLTDYASAGKLWNEESKMAAWIRTTKSYRKEKIK